MHNLPKNSKIVPNPDTNPILAGFLKIRNVASLAAGQKLFPYIIVYI